MNRDLHISFLLFSVLICGGCSSQFHVLGDYAGNFSKNAIREIRTHSDPKNDLSEMVIGVIEFHEETEIGLYFYKIYKTPRSVQAINKVLKFESKLVFPTADKDRNESILQEFESNYKFLFNPEQFIRIRESFLKGTEFSGRTL